jgi:hypothetical protein
MTDQALTAARSEAAPLSLPLLIGCNVYALMLAVGPKLLRDADIYWHLVVGQWVVAHGAVPHTDMFSQTFLGQPWIAKEWLSQVLYATAYAAAGWSGIVVLAAVAIAAAFAMLTHELSRYLGRNAVLLFVLAALVLTAPHLVARPHVLALPFMVAWVAGLMRANDCGRAPSLMLVPLITLWANLHGGFTLGLALMAPIAFEAVWNAAPHARKVLALRWLRFVLVAVAAACITPYGPESMLVTYRVLSLGAALSSIAEWRAQDFTHLGAFEIAMLAALAFALYRGVRLPPMRILLVLGLLHLALSAVRNAELFALLGPPVLAAPLARQIGEQSPSTDERVGLLGRSVLMALLALTALVVRTQSFTPSPEISPIAAVEKLKQIDRPVLNEYDLGGYLVYAGIAPFIDGRTELYGEEFYMRWERAVTLQDVGDLLQLLDQYGIGATLLKPSTPAVTLLDRLPGWERIHADATAVLHRRTPSVPVLHQSFNLH